MEIQVEGVRQLFETQLVQGLGHPTFGFAVLRWMIVLVKHGFENDQTI